MSKSNKNKPTLGRRLVRIVIYGFVIFVLLLLTTAAVFHTYKDDIGKKVILSVNDLQNGEINFSKISLTPFMYFPGVSVKLHDVNYFAKPNEKYTTGNDTIASIRNLYVALDIIDLIKGKINVSKITLEDGKIRLVKYPDSTINLFNALGVGEISPAPALPKQVDTIDHNKGLDINLDEIVLNSISLEFINFNPDGHVKVDITDLKASLQIQPDTLNFSINSEFLLKELSINDNLSFYNQILRVRSEVVYNRSKNIIQIDNGNLKLNELNFNVDGYINMSEKSEVDLTIEGDTKDVTIFRLFLSENGLQNLTSGETYFTGTVSGSYNGVIPRMEFDFGFRNVSISLPDVTSNISGLSLEGHFNSGIKSDFSQAQLQIGNLQGQLPGGYINARLSVDNFVVPSINIFWDMKTDITGFDEIFKIGTIDSLHGSIAINNEFVGVYNPINRSLETGKSKSVILLDSLTFNIPGIMQVNKLDGGLRSNLDTIWLSDLKFHANNTDFSIDGEIVNFYSLLLNEEKDIWASLMIKSDTFDFPAFFSFDPRVGKSFPYQVKNIDMKLLARSTTSKLLEFEYNPEITFEVDQMVATIDKLFPPITIDKGDIILSEKNGRILLTFKEFDLQAAQGEMLANVEYYSPPVDPDVVDIEVQVIGINPGRLFLGPLDSIPPIADGILNGFVKSKLEIGLDTIDFETFNITTDKLVYTTRKDTFDIENLYLQADKIFYKSIDQIDLLATLYADILLQAGRIRSNYFNVEGVSYNIKARNGTFTVIPEKIQFFGKEGSGIYNLSPFQDEPRYELKYSVNQFQVEKFLTNVLSDTILTGKMDLDMDVILTGSKQVDLFSNLNGYFHINGKNLTLHGLDIDKVLEKYTRSQKFNLVDVGAVVIAGPYGLAVTKGSDFASLALGSIGETTPIGNLISEWDMANGKLILKDVAFSTEKNLIAGKGWIDLATDSLEVTVAVLDKKGCSIFSQTLYGTLENPQQSEIKIVGTFLGPITNLINGALGKDCEVFYDGKLSHPSAK